MLFFLFLITFWLFSIQSLLKVPLKDGESKKPRTYSLWRHFHSESKTGEQMKALKLYLNVFHCSKHRCDFNSIRYFVTYD